ncbi:Serine protease precursor MucD/AlgY associated with sigma factor RpoE [hydrothermal vent metagenome]|uniref:Serine protease MucD/AlgY associated with sigma factor RpoE n=1 Tax=hydrothermal vent metagenome TaxID=652676 RepID=A0A3B1ANY4_9ZZZZ
MTNHTKIIQFFLVFFSILIINSSSASTQDIFKEYKNRLLQIRIIDKSTAAKSTIGSGFYINNKGFIVTNYHVIERVIYRPEQYRIEVETSKEISLMATLVNVDVIHDLALLKIDDVSLETPYLKLLSATAKKGKRIYSLGNPHDLGMTIVEGTYNGFTDDTEHERILLTSSINPGMSGGPSITNKGEIIGVNVATAGNQIGFLVPAKYVTQLIKKQTTSKNFIKDVTSQLLANQDQYMQKINNSDIKTTQLAKFTVPDKLSSYITCWGDSTDDSDSPYQSSSRTCSTKNNIYVSRGFETGEIKYTHYYIHTTEMNRYQFHALLQHYFSGPEYSFSGRKDDMTEFRCQTNFVNSNSILFKTALCLRTYKKLIGLYDVVLHAITLNNDNKSLQTTLSLSGISYDNAISFTHSYLEAFKWNNP